MRIQGIDIEIKYEEYFQTQKLNSNKAKHATVIQKVA